MASNIGLFQITTMIKHNEVAQLQDAIDNGEVTSDDVEQAAKQMLESGEQLPDLTQGIGRKSLFSRLKDKLHIRLAGKQLENIFSSAIMYHKEEQSAKATGVFGNLQDYFNPALTRSSDALRKLKLAEGSREKEFNRDVSPHYLEGRELNDYVYGETSESGLRPRVGDLIVFKIGRSWTDPNNVTIAGKLKEIVTYDNVNYCFVLEDQISSSSLHPDFIELNGEVRFL